jgi:hypothetical protein
MISFAVIRCPYRRFESLARFAFRDEAALPPDYTDRLKAMLNDPARRDHILLRPQHHFVCDDHGEVRISMLLRHEQLVEDMDQLSARLGLALPPMERVNASPAGDAFVPDAEMLDLVRHHYADDFRIFGYDAECQAR